MPYELFWHLNPRKLKPFVEAQKQKQRLLDNNMWLMGMYIQSAVSVAVEHNLAGKKAQSKYLEKPLWEMQEENSEELTEEQKAKRVKNIFMELELRKANFDLEKQRKEKLKQGGE